MRNRLACGWLTAGALAAAGAFLAPVTESPAYPPYLDAWKDRYPTSTIPGRMASLFGLVCFTCHIPQGFSLEGSCYRIDIRDRLKAGMTIEQALADVEFLDSDGDGAPNVVEILTRRSDLPQHVGYHPGLEGPLGVSPCGVPPGTVVTNMPETPCYPDCNSDGVLNLADFGCFQTRFALGDPYADCNTDGVTNLADFGCFQTQFAFGCPEP
jgi:hypothetical protein